MNKQQALISDIDGTISDRRHRLHHIQGKKDWDSFFEALVDDPVIQDTVDQIESLLSANITLIFVSGRFERYRSITENWIEENTSFKSYELFMRDNKDYRKDIIVKKEMLEKIKECYSVNIVFEDQSEIAIMWTKSGLECRLVGYD